MPYKSKSQHPITYYKDKSRPRNIWVLSKGRYTDWDLSRIWEGAETKTVTEYKISDLGRYLLNPNPIEIRKKLIGCEIHYPRLFISSNQK